MCFYLQPGFGFMKVKTISVEPLDARVRNWFQKDCFLCMIIKVNFCLKSSKYKSKSNLKSIKGKSKLRLMILWGRFMSSFWGINPSQISTLRGEIQIMSKSSFSLFRVKTNSNFKYVGHKSGKTRSSLKSGEEVQLKVEYLFLKSKYK